MINISISKKNIIRASIFLAALFFVMLGFAVKNALLSKKICDYSKSLLLYSSSGLCENIAESERLINEYASSEENSNTLLSEIISKIGKCEVYLAFSSTDTFYLNDFLIRLKNR